MKPAWRNSVVAVMVFGGSLMMVSSVEARGGMSTAQKKAIQAQMQQQQQMQQNLTKAQQKKDQELMDRFDNNKNGKIDPSEKTAWDKYWRDVRLNKTPHPYSTITQADLNPRPQQGPRKPLRPKSPPPRRTTTNASAAIGAAKVGAASRAAPGLCAILARPPRRT